MEELRSWWEVPAIAHFCNVFQTTFNLFYFDVEELELSLLQENMDESVSIENLIIRLLPRCCGVTDIDSSNWEDHLRKLLEQRWSREGRANPLANVGSRFYSLPLRSKVEILYSLCHYRLDAVDAYEEVKNLDGKCLRADCVGFDSEKNIYWYFGGTRLYKEDQSNKITFVKKVSRTKECAQIKSPVNWSVVCFTKEDWEDLLKRLRRKKNATDRKFCDNVENNYLPVLSAIIARKERELKKRLIELAPRRYSSRIDEVRKKKEVEEQRAAALAEQERLRKAAEEESRRMLEEQSRKQKEIMDRARRAKERCKALEGCTTRARYRDLLGLPSEDDYDSDMCSPLDEASEQSESEDIIELGSVTVSDETATLSDQNAHSDAKSHESESEEDDESTSDKDTDSGNEELYMTAKETGRCKRGNLKKSYHSFRAIESGDESSGSEEYIPIFSKKGVMYVKSRVVNGKNKSCLCSSPTWRHLKAARVPLQDVCDYDMTDAVPREDSAAGQKRPCNARAKAQHNIQAPAKKLGLTEKTHRIYPVIPGYQQYEGSSDSESSSSSSCVMEVQSSHGDEKICRRKTEVFPRNITCGSNSEKGRKTLTCNYNNSQDCVSLKNSKNDSLQNMMPMQKSGLQQKSPIFTHKKIKIAKPDGDPIQGMQQTATSSKSTLSCLKRVSVPCKRLDEYSVERELKTYEVKGNYKISSPAIKVSEPVVKLEVMNRTQVNISNTVSSRPTWNCLKQVSVPCKRVDEYSDKSKLSPCEVKRNCKFFPKNVKVTEPGTKLEVRNGTQTTVSHLH